MGVVRRQWVFVGIAAIVALAVGGWLYASRTRSTANHVAAVAMHGRPAGYVDPKLCAGCHVSIYATYQKTGMRRSFYVPRPENTVEDYTKNNQFFHTASASYYQMLQRDGKYYQRRYQRGLDGKETNVEEKQIDYVVGSGNHVRVYVHRTPRNTLVELPLAWYSEKGGYWAMNPGYDKADHPGSRRALTYDCLFCHNAYSAIPAGHEQLGAEPVFPAEMPEGVDCQRCHGPGAEHIRVAGRPSAKPEEVRKSIINPARLSQERQMEVCVQCHLETSSARLPHSVVRYEREPFSYRPGEPIENFVLNFDTKAGYKEDRFEIVNSVYRLRKSQCFIKTNGALRCTSCHNPHNVAHGQEAAAQSNKVCRECHAADFDKLVASGRHTATGSCVSCHMPPRRTEDVVHAVMTDHYIQRRPPPPKKLLAEIAEYHETDDLAYHGEVLPYPKVFTNTPDNELLTAVAQVRQKSNLQNGITQLTAAIEKYRPARPEYYFELANAWLDSGKPLQAVPLYEEAIRRRPGFLPALQSMGVALTEGQQPARAIEVFQQMLQLAPDNASAWQSLGELYLQQNRATEAETALQKAVVLDPDMPAAHNSLGSLWAARGDWPRAEAEFREAVRIRPDYAEALSNLGNVLAARDNLPEALSCFQKAVFFSPEYALARFNYGALLNGMRRFAEAEVQLRAAVQANPAHAEAHEMLGNLLERRGQISDALHEYQEAVRLRPGFSRAELDLGAVLARQGDRQGAMDHLQRAAGGNDPAVREMAHQVLAQLR